MEESLQVQELQLRITVVDKLLAAFVGISVPWMRVVTLFASIAEGITMGLGPLLVVMAPPKIAVMF
jgi:hypothetical protein